IGNDLNNELGGGGGNDVVRGNAGNDLLFGGDGNDLLDGRSAADRMDGGNGNDLYVVDQGIGYGSGDVVGKVANGGIDTVEQNVALYYLGANVENLVLNVGAVTGVGNALDNTITGNGLNNEIGGGEGNDVLNGRGGADTIYTGAGKDLIVFQRGEANGDVVVDFDGNGAGPGDTLQFSGYGPGATFTNVDATHWEVNY